MNEEVTAYIENAPHEFRAIMQLVRELLHQTVPNIREEYKWNRPVFKTKSDFSYMLLNKKDVTIGLTKDIELLIDPNHILKGSGKTMRHFKLKNVSDLDCKLLIEWSKVITSDAAANPE